MNHPLLLAGALIASAGLLSCSSGGEVSRSPPDQSGPKRPEVATGQQRAGLGEVVDGYPSDQERMVHVLTNLSRHAPKNHCADYSTQFPDSNRPPLVYSRVGNQAARFTSTHLADIGCFQHESCCVLGNVGGQVQCTAPAQCAGGTCDKDCTGGTSTAGRYGLLGMNNYSGENLARGQTSAYEAWCAWIKSDGHRANIYSNHTQLGVGLAPSPGCGRYWTQGFGSGGVQIPRIPVASAMHAPPNPSDAANLSFAANYFDASARAPRRAVVVVDGQCMDLVAEWGKRDNGTWTASFPSADAVPPGCYPYYFLFVDADADRWTYPDQGSLFVAIGAGQSCPQAYAPFQRAASCETGQQTCEEGEVEDCYTGPEGTLGVGECRSGFQVCQNGFWSACRQQRLPISEKCDGLDNNCDGQVDEGELGGTSTCPVQGELGECARGTHQCVAGKMVCISVRGPQPEVCDGLDNDCDGLVDDGLGSLFCGQGECFRYLPACINGVEQSCVPGEPSAEVADGKDNDCNGLIDDGLDCRDTHAPGAQRLCYSFSRELPDGGTREIIPPCQRGVQQCQQDGTWGPCAGEVGPTQEVCDGKDNDCDGQIDEHQELGYLRCGTGVCMNAGPSCRSGKPASCEPRPAQVEVCNGLDDNCDGAIDEGCLCRDGEFHPCYTGPLQLLGIGVCRQGTRTCEQGRWAACEGEVVPTVEYCNGLDDDCNGEVDDGCLPLPQDGGTPPDAGTTDAVDAGGQLPEPQDGCGCAAGSGAGALPLALGALLALGRRRRL